MQSAAKTTLDQNSRTSRDLGYRADSPTIAMGSRASRRSRSAECVAFTARLSWLGPMRARARPLGGAGNGATSHSGPAVSTQPAVAYPASSGARKQGRDHVERVRAAEHRV